MLLYAFLARKLDFERVAGYLDVVHVHVHRHTGGKRAERAADVGGDIGHPHPPLGDDMDLDPVARQADSGHTSAGKVRGDLPDRAGRETSHRCTGGRSFCDGIRADAVERL